MAVERLTDEQTNAVREFVDVWGRGETLHDIATQLTCTEATVVAELFETFGIGCAEFLREHAEGDIDEVDLHGHLRAVVRG